MGDIERVKRLAAYYARLYHTRNPFELADRMGILYQVGDLPAAGCYMFLKNHRYIFLSSQLEEPEKSLVMAHELGHAILDRKTNCYFIRNKTLLLTSRLGTPGKPVRRPFFNIGRTSEGIRRIHRRAVLRLHRVPGGGFKPSPDVKDWGAICAA